MNSSAHSQYIIATIQRAVDSLIRISMNLCSIATVIMMFLINIEIILRSFFHVSLLFADELCGYLLVAITFLGISYCLRTGALLRIKFFLFSLPPRIRMWVNLVYDLLSLVFSIIVTYELFRMVWGSYILNIRAPTLRETPLYIPEFVMPLGMSLLTLALLSEICNDLHIILGKEANKVDFLIDHKEGEVL